jgi:DNA-binding transcriptional LysR family regulator
MFEKLFAESGLSMDRLRALLEVGAAGSIVKAANGDPVRQSQYSRQIKELEDFFRSRLIERQGKGTRLTLNGRELARISRFFMLGLSNFQRGCLAKEQQFRVGASATFIQQFLLPVLAGPSNKERVTYSSEAIGIDEIERRLHDLTLDFGITIRDGLSRPLQSRALGKWKLELWVPRRLGMNEAKAAQALQERRLPLVFAAKESEGLGASDLSNGEGHLICDNFLEARTVLDRQKCAALIPGFLRPRNSKLFLQLRLSSLDANPCCFYFAWNPRLLRLNPHAARRRDLLIAALAKQFEPCDFPILPVVRAAKPNDTKRRRTRKPSKKHSLGT